MQELTNIIRSDEVKVLCGIHTLLIWITFFLFLTVCCLGLIIYFLRYFQY